MSRTVGAGLLALAQSNAPTLAWAIVVTRQDATVYRWTTHDRDVVIASNTYASAPGIDVRQLVSTSGFVPDNTEVRILADDEITRPDILAGRWDAAGVSLGVFNWKDTSQGIAIFLTGTLGDMRPRDGEFVAELRDLRQALQQDTTDVVQPDCRYRLGDAKCTKVITSPPFTVTGSVTGVTSRYVFTDTARTEADDYFGAGEVQFTSGLNAGLRFLVRSYAADVFTLALPTPFAITAADAYTAIAGCRHRFAEDCVGKFANGVNFGGEPHKARIDALLALPI
jgi:uncharacterized phage protein (TIGR02218 family)